MSESVSTPRLPPSPIVVVGGELVDYPQALLLVRDALNIRREVSSLIDYFGKKVKRARLQPTASLSAGWERLKVCGFSTTYWNVPFPVQRPTVRESPPMNVHMIKCAVLLAE